MNAFERAKRIYLVLQGRLSTPELRDRDISIIKSEIEDAIRDERADCARIAENFHYSATELWHPEQTEAEKTVGMNIARAIRARYHS